jgi:hypothetical protein
MENGHLLRNALLLVVGLVVAGLIALWAINFVLHLVLYVVVGALVVGGAMFLYGRAKRALGGGRHPLDR